MTTDRTWFDERLKGNLYLDICLRAVIWLFIAFLTINYASLEIGFSPITPLQTGFNNLMPVIANVTRVALTLCFLALLLKDLEYVAPDLWGQETFAGKVGGVVRKLAGDLSLWVIGAMVTILASLLYLSMYLYNNREWSPDVTRFSTTVGLVLVISIAIFSVANVWVRKRESLISSHEKLQKSINSPWKVVCFYGFLIGVTIIGR